MSNEAAAPKARSPLSPDEVEAIIEAKEEWRRRLRARRGTHTKRQRAERAEAIADVLDSIPAVREARSVAAYAARSSEPDTRGWMSRALARQQRVILPVLGTGLARDWALLTSLEDLQERAPGRPPEPSGPSLGARAIADVDVVIAPALAIDTWGRRLGQGGGWFDRVLGLVPRGVPVISLVYDDELFDGFATPLPIEPHDLLVTAVATPAGWRTLAPGQGLDQAHLSAGAAEE
ncbi:MAG: 5-formyltetrahydrofolate cyclo-ligase [Promicromonosporaceae bacterium]|nr:5-formyltetrahydrofolate cyclo-ligase [Promicromonosporaceae bacterium]